MMQRLTVRDVMAPLVVSVAWTGFLFVTEGADAAGKDRVEIPSIIKHFGKVEKKLVFVKDESRSGSTPPACYSDWSESNRRSKPQRVKGRGVHSGVG